eukprot:snap_masked-scaffold_4-processed-gene-12.21-mRNA-1 protein AED:1.00 eAED:1.00 QI:0/0/0/0/1/1/2/0/59
MVGAPPPVCSRVSYFYKISFSFRCLILTKLGAYGISPILGIELNGANLYLQPTLYILNE